MKSLRTRIRWDTYTLIMVALVPVILLSAWGLTKASEHDLRSRQCAMAEEWLDESRALLPLFYRAGTVQNTTAWVSALEELSSPAAAGRLRWAVLQSTRYAAEYYPDLPTDEVAVLNPTDGLYQRNLTEGARDLINHCPEVASMLPQAFPMVFKEDEFP
ncbi:MAG: hypothetical protein M9953_05940 [Thermomicrobiales bacterium]|nr:hypothetical protein [Thermomicrobiales bacterium]MCO5228964.1 hypothetical protein [Thermomicrobiales bacterium]